MRAPSSGFQTLFQTFSREVSLNFHTIYPLIWLPASRYLKRVVVVLNCQNVIIKYNPFQMLLAFEDPLMKCLCLLFISILSCLFFLIDYRNASFILAWPLFAFNFSKVSFHCHLAPSVSLENNTILLMCL